MTVSLIFGVILFVVAGRAADIQGIVSTPIGQLTITQIVFVVVYAVYATILIYSAILVVVAAIAWLRPLD